MSLNKFVIGVCFLVVLALIYNDWVTAPAKPKSGRKMRLRTRLWNRFKDWFFRV